MEFISTNLPGLRLIKPLILNDERGEFVKTFQHKVFREHHLEFAIQEEFFSSSSAGVLRGMHFQVPPAAHAKLVYCITGSVLDVVLDLRKESPTFGHVHARELNSANREMLFIPLGFAHGFLALQDQSTLVYLTSAAHSPTHDTGVRWDSIDFAWPIKSPLVSTRDGGFPAFADFSSPF